MWSQDIGVQRVANLIQCSSQLLNGFNSSTSGAGLRSSRTLRQVSFYHNKAPFCSDTCCSSFLWLRRRCCAQVTDIGVQSLSKVHDSQQLSREAWSTHPV